MKDIQDVIRDLSASTTQFLAALADFPDALFNMHPTNGGWAASGVAEHILILEGLINKVIEGPVEMPEGRKPDEKIALIKEAFQNEKTKLSAPSIIAPKRENWNKEEVINSIRETRKNMTSSIAFNDLAPVCLAHIHHVFGSLSRLEWVYFCIYHAERHQSQLQRILTDLQKA